MEVRSLSFFLGGQDDSDIDFCLRAFFLGLILISVRCVSSWASVFASVGMILGTIIGSQSALMRLGKDLEGSELVAMVRRAIKEDRERRGLGEKEDNPYWPFPKDLGAWSGGLPEGVTLAMPPTAADTGASTAGASTMPKEGEKKVNRYGDSVE